MMAEFRPYGAQRWWVPVRPAPFSLVLRQSRWRSTPHVQPQFACGRSPVAGARRGAGAGDHHCRAAAGDAPCRLRGGHRAPARARTRARPPLSAYSCSLRRSPRWAGRAWGMPTTLGLAVLVSPKRSRARIIRRSALRSASPRAYWAGAPQRFRHAGLRLEPHHPSSSTDGLCRGCQAVQAAGLGLYLAIRDRAALAAVIAGWRQSLGAELFGTRSLRRASSSRSNPCSQPRPCARWGDQVPISRAPPATGCSARR